MSTRRIRKEEHRMTISQDLFEEHSISITHRHSINSFRAAEKQRRQGDEGILRVPAGRPH